MKPISVGTAAPEFTLMDQNEQQVCLSDYKGKKVLLSWHPLAWTPVCTDQMRALENNFDKFTSLNTIPLGLSSDPPPCKKAWASALLLESLRLPCDFWPHGNVAQAYGIFNEKDGVSERANIIIDENGKVMWAKVYPAAQLPDISEILKVIGG